MTSARTTAANSASASRAETTTSAGSTGPATRAAATSRKASYTRRVASCTRASPAQKSSQRPRTGRRPPGTTAGTMIVTVASEASCEVNGDPGDSATMKIALAGGTDVLDEVVITVQDESGTGHWGRGLPAGVTQERAEAFARGPWELDVNASAQVISNRQTRPRPCPPAARTGTP
jgi:hypothetical protein